MLDKAIESASGINEEEDGCAVAKVASSKIEAATRSRPSAFEERYERIMRYAYEFKPSDKIAD